MYRPVYRIRYENG
jgi:cytosolic carboxypeptidase protein 5